MEVSTLLRLASWLYKVAGLPVSSDSDSLTPAQVLVTVLCFCNHTILSIINLYILLTTENPNDYEMFIKLFWTLYPLLCAVVTSVMTFQHQSFKRMCLRVEYIGEMMKVKFTCKSMICQVTAFCLTTLTLSSIVLSLLTNAHEFPIVYKSFARFDGAAVVLTISFILHIPSAVLFFAILYHTCLQYLVELRVVEEVHRDVSASTSVLLPVAEDGTSLNLSRCRELLDVYFEAKKVHLETESWLHFPLCVIMFTSAWYYPLLASEYRGPENESIYRHILTAYIIIGSVLKLGPICINQLLAYRKSLLLGEVARNVIKTEDPKLKQMLLNLFACIRDEYPNSPDVFVDFNFTFLTMLVDAAILVITTFF